MRESYFIYVKKSLQADESVPVFYTIGPLKGLNAVSCRIHARVDGENLLRGTLQMRMDVTKARHMCLAKITTNL